MKILKSKRFWCPVMIILIIAFDRLTKYLSISFLYPDKAVTVIKGFLEFRYAENTGMAFSMLSGARIFFLILTGIVIIGCLVFMFSKKCDDKLWLFWTLGVLVSGGAGNFIDRLFYGYVVDFINPLFVNFAVFNIADCAVTLATISLVLYLLFGGAKEEKANE